MAMPDPALALHPQEALHHWVNDIFKKLPFRKIAAHIIILVHALYLFQIKLN